MDKELLNQEKSFIAMCKFLLWLFTALVITFIGMSGVLAWDWTNANGITYTAIGYVTNDTQIQIEVTYNTSSGAPLPVAVDQTVNTEIKTLYINLSNYTFLANTRYELELNLPNNKLVYANTYSVQGYNGEQCMISLSDSEFNSEYSRFDFQCPSATNSIAISVYNSNNTAITQSGIFSWHYSHLYSSTMPINSSTTNNNDLINNANQNADRIIDNQNQNTQDIINNQNANTDREIESQKVCKSVQYNFNRNSSDLTQNKFLTTTGDEVTNQNYSITPYIELSSGDIVLLQNYSYMVSSAFCFYNKDKVIISCESWNSRTNITTVAPNNTYYIRSSIGGNVNITIKGSHCINGNQALNDSINGLNDSINDDDIDDATSEASDFFSDFNTNTFGLTSIITAPLNLIQSLTSSSCTALHLPLPYLDNKYLDLPCMSSIYSQYFGSFFTLYQTITYGIIAYWVCVRVFNLVKDFKNPEHDEIEVVDL